VRLRRRLKLFVDRRRELDRRAGRNDAHAEDALEAGERRRVLAPLAWLVAGLELAYQSGQLCALAGRRDRRDADRLDDGVNQRVAERAVLEQAFETMDATVGRAVGVEGQVRLRQQAVTGQDDRRRRRRWHRGHLDCAHAALRLRDPHRLLRRRVRPLFMFDGEVSDAGADSLEQLPLHAFRRVEPAFVTISEMKRQTAGVHPPRSLEEQATGRAGWLDRPRVGARVAEKETADERPPQLFMRPLS